MDAATKMSAVSELHCAASRGDKRRIKQILDTGVDVDLYNELGQTPLFVACYQGHKKTASLLLDRGANPNAKSNTGSTPVHMACFSSSCQILIKLIEAGGDMRLHDNCGQSVKDWALKHADPDKRRKMLQCIERIKFNAMSLSHGNLQPGTFSDYRRMGSSNDSSLSGIFKRLHGTPKTPSVTSSRSFLSLGFGKIYDGGRDSGGTFGTVPLVSEDVLLHDREGYTFACGPHSICESMQWRKTPVSVKRLERAAPKGAHVDHLIHESEEMGRIRHPNILLMMGLCQTKDLEELMIIYERITMGSLYSYMYERGEAIKVVSMCDIMSQVAKGLVFLHESNMLHNFVSSHSVYLVSNNIAKIGNFEYVTNRTGDLHSYPDVYHNQHNHLHGAANWMAPELMDQGCPSVESDLYSFCAVVWEILTGSVPWSELQPVDIKYRMIERKKRLPISTDMPCPFDILLAYGLHLDKRVRRDITLEHLHDVFTKIVLENHEEPQNESMEQSKIEEAPENNSRKESTMEVLSTPRLETPKASMEWPTHDTPSKNENGDFYKPLSHNSIKHGLEVQEENVVPQVHVPKKFCVKFPLPSASESAVSHYGQNSADSFQSREVQELVNSLHSLDETDAVPSGSLSDECLSPINPFKGYLTDSLDTIKKCEVDMFNQHSLDETVTRLEPLEELSTSTPATRLTSASGFPGKATRLSKSSITVTLDPASVKNRRKPITTSMSESTAGVQRKIKMPQGTEIKACHHPPGDVLSENLSSNTAKPSSFITRKTFAESTRSQDQALVKQPHVFDETDAVPSYSDSKKRSSQINPFKQYFTESVGTNHTFLPDMSNECSLHESSIRLEPVKEDLCYMPPCKLQTSSRHRLKPEKRTQKSHKKGVLPKPSTIGSIKAVQDKTEGPQEVEIQAGALGDASFGPSQKATKRSSFFSSVKNVMQPGTKTVFGTLSKLSTLIAPQPFRRTSSASGQVMQINDISLSPIKTASSPNVRSPTRTLAISKPNSGRSTYRYLPKSDICNRSPPTKKQTQVISSDDVDMCAISDDASADNASAHLPVCGKCAAFKPAAHRTSIDSFPHGGSGKLNLCRRPSTQGSKHLLLDGKGLPCRKRSTEESSGNISNSSNDATEKQDVRALIKSFTDKASKHKKKQAVLCLKSQRISDATMQSLRDDGIPVHLDSEHSPRVGASGDTTNAAVERNIGIRTSALTPTSELETSARHVASATIFLQLEKELLARQDVCIQEHKSPKKPRDDSDKHDLRATGPSVDSAERFQPIETVQNMSRNIPRMGLMHTVSQTSNENPLQQTDNIGTESFTRSTPPDLSSVDLTNVTTSYREPMTESTKSFDIVEYYFDDVIHPGIIKEKHMRLQTTMQLDPTTPGNIQPQGAPSRTYESSLSLPRNGTSDSSDTCPNNIPSSDVDAPIQLDNGSNAQSVHSNIDDCGDNMEIASTLKQEPDQHANDNQHSDEIQEFAEQSSEEELQSDRQPEPQVEVPDVQGASAETMDENDASAEYEPPHVFIDKAFSDLDNYISSDNDVDSDPERPQNHQVIHLNGEPGFTTAVTIETCHDDPCVHTVTTSRKDLRSGLTMSDSQIITADKLTSQVTFNQ